MDKRLVFSEDVLNYDLWRPRYNSKLFEDIFNYAQIIENSTIVEIGCGTGQATEPFLIKGCNVHVIELAEKMAVFSKEKFAAYCNCLIDNIDFENCSIESASIDLVFAATAFHWVDEKIGYTKTMDMLKLGGSIALFWNHPYVARVDDPLHQEIQRVYRRYEEEGIRPKSKTPIENDTERYERIQNTILEHGFINVKFKLYKKTRHFKAEEYICLLNTYSDHRNMEKEPKKKFEKEIIDAISAYGGVLNIYDNIDLYLAQKQN